MFKFLKPNNQVIFLQNQLRSRPLSNSTRATLFLLLLLAADFAFAQNAGTGLTTLFDKIVDPLSGVLGKIIMAVGLLLSALAALAGMNRAVILTPIGIGFLLGNAKTIINWMFP